MKRLLAYLFIALLWCNTANSATLGKGEVKMSDESVRYFISWVKMKKIDNGQRCKPSMFIMSADGKWTQGNRCCWTTCHDTASTKIIKECERATGTLCGVFSMRRVIFWDNGRKKGKRIKFNSKMTDSEIRAKLKEFGFIGDSIQQTPKKIEKKENTTALSSELINDLKALKELYDEGVLTKEEFEKAKKSILNN